MWSLILFLPLFSFILTTLFGRFFGKYACAFICTFSLFLTFLLALFLFYEVCLSQTIVIVKFYNWFIIDVYKVEFGLLFDSITCLMVVVITTISLLVHMFSISYMSHDPYLSRFMSYLSFFTFFMLFLVTSSNFIQMFIGWEGVGLCSYLLINFWFTRVAANKAALKAMIVNRISDVFLMFGIVLILITFKTTNYIVVFNLIPFILNDFYILFNIKVKLIVLIAFFLFIGAIGKSAQFGFHIWLPDAMEGPTPVSALLHAATMVTAGVFLILRSSTIFEYSEIVQIFLIIIGSITALYAGFTAFLQYDVKKIIAYSTCSQLGYMFFSLGLSNYSLAFFHLFNHAFFKALLFLSAGILIHNSFDEQDLRKMGVLKDKYPFLYIIFVIGSLAIMGFPFLTGYYSKDVIMEYAFSVSVIDGMFIYIISIFSAFLTILYSMKIVYFVFFSKHKQYRVLYLKIIKNTHEDLFDYIYIPVIVLTFFSITVGYLGHDLIIGFGTYFWNNSIYNLPNQFTVVNCEFVSFFIKNLPFFLTVIFMRLSIVFFEYFSFPETSIPKWNLFYYLKQKCFFSLSFFFNTSFFNVLYSRLFNLIYNYSYNHFYKLLDKGIFEYILIFVTAKITILSYILKNIMIFKENNNIFFNIFFNIIVLILMIVFLCISFFYNIDLLYIVVKNLMVLLLIIFFY